MLNAMRVGFCCIADSWADSVEGYNLSRTCLFSDVTFVH